MMDALIRQRLDSIEQLANQILCEIHGIYGYCQGMEMVANDLYPSSPLIQPPAQIGNGSGNQQLKSPKEIVEEIKTMIVELKIKGSVRERANGLIEYRSKLLGSIYGRSKEDIEQQITTRLKEVKKKERQRKKEEFCAPTDFDSFAMYWFENFHKRKVKENTYKHNAWLYTTHIQKLLATYQINKIPPTLLQSMFDRFADRGKLREDVRSLLNQIFSSAIQHGIMSVNPLAMCFVEAHERQHGKAFTKEEERRLLAAYEGSDYQACFAIIIYTGLRPNEYPTIEIEEQFIKAVNSKRKSRKIAYKRIPITPMLRPYIDSYNKMYSTQMLDDKLKAILPNHKLYDMRTTFQTRCTECGISDVAIGLFMGNSIGGALKEAYTDLSDEYLLREGEKLNY